VRLADWVTHEMFLKKGVNTSLWALLSTDTGVADLRGPTREDRSPGRNVSRSRKKPIPAADDRKRIKGAESKRCSEKKSES